MTEPGEETMIEKELSADQVTEIEALVEQTMDEAQILGLALGIVKDGELVYAKGYGVAK